MEINIRVEKFSIELIDQGSPFLWDMTLDGLQNAIAQAVPAGHKAHMVRYTDDFIVVGDDREVLEDKVKPAIEQFLLTRGLKLSKEKTQLSHINDGFDFLGFNVRKYKGKLLIKPCKNNIHTLLATVREIIKSNPSAKTQSLIYLLNPKIRGWCNYYRHVVASRIFGYIDHCIYDAVNRWIKRRHPNKSRHWQFNRYFCQVKGDRWRFYATFVHKDVHRQLLLVRASSVKIRRHVKMRAMANPYDPKDQRYFAKRSRKYVSSRH